MVKIIYLFLFYPILVFGIDANFVRAIHLVESSGRVGNIQGDFNKKTGKYSAKGPLQIHLACWQDSKIPGKYENCADLNYSIRVMEAICLRYEPKALKENDFNSLARLWNGGCGWRKNPKATDNYVRKFQKAYKSLSKR